VRVHVDEPRQQQELAEVDLRHTASVDQVTRQSGSAPPVTLPVGSAAPVTRQAGSVAPVTLLAGSVEPVIRLDALDDAAAHRDGGGRRGAPRDASPDPPRPHAERAGGHHPADA
jgi:hypothetical protein